MTISPDERTCRRALTFLLNEIDPTGWPVGRLHEFARLLDGLPSSYQVKARTRHTTAVAELIRRRNLTALAGIEGQQVFPGQGDGFDDIRAEVNTLTGDSSFEWAS